MATTLALAMRASMSATGVVSGANDAARAMDRMGKQAQQTARDVSILKNIAIGAVVFKGVGMAADMFTSATRAAIGYASSVANTVDQMNDLAERTGMGVEELQALQMAAKLSGVDDVSGAIQKLGLSIGQAADQGKTDAFTKLGIDFDKLVAMSPAQQFAEVQRAISSLRTPTEQAAAAVSIFGKSGVELLPLMSKNIGDIEERMRSLGAIVSEDQVGAIGAMNDALDMAKATFDGITAQVVSYLAPAVQDVAEAFMNFVADFEGGGTGLAESIAERLIEAAKFMAGVFDKFIEGLGKFMEGLGSWVSSDLEQAGKGVRKFGASRTFSGAVGTAEDFFNDRNSPARVAAREQREAERKARREAAAAADKAAREAEAQKKREEDAAKRAADAKEKADTIQKRIENRAADADATAAERLTLLNTSSNEALQNNDVRTSEGMSKVLALVTKREDPAIEEYRRQTEKLEQIRAELKALEAERVEILGGAAA